MEPTKQINSVLRAFVVKKDILKINDLWYITTLWSAELSKSFSQLIMSIFIFSQYFFQQILKSVNDWKSVGLPHIAYIMIH